MGIKRQAAGLFTGAALVAGVLAATAAPAQAYSPDPKVGTYYRDTGDCPCSGGTLSDPFDGTYFQHDPGGYAVKMELSKDSWFVGKAEFHPYDEKLYVYDTKNDGDTFYAHVEYSYKGTRHSLGTHAAPGTSAVVDYAVWNFDIPEGAYVDITLYDGKGGTDYIAGAQGTGGAIA